MRSNITAFTPPGFAPPFFSVNTLEDGRIEIIVRSVAKEDGSCGDIASITMSAEQFSKSAREMFSFACTGAS